MPESDPAPAVVSGSGVRVYHGGTEILGIIDVTPPAPKTDATETHHMLSPQKVKTFKPGWITPGDMKVKFHYSAATYAALLTLQMARTVESWKVSFDDGSYFLSDGFVSDLPTTPDMEKLVDAECTVTLSGPATFSPTA